MKFDTYVRIAVAPALATLLALLGGCQGGTDGFADPPGQSTPANISLPKNLVKQPEAPSGENTKAKTRAEKPLVDEKKLGIPFYPNAKPVSDEGAKLAVTNSEDFQLVVLETTDSLAKVEQFYRSKLPNAEADENRKPNTPFVLLSEGTDGYMRSVEAETVRGKTRITLSRIQGSSEPSASNLPAPPQADSALPNTEPDATTPSSPSLPPPPP